MPPQIIQTSDGTAINSLQELREYCDTQTVADAFANGTLTAWLKGIGCIREAEETALLDPKAIDLPERLCQILGFPQCATTDAELAQVHYNLGLAQLDTSQNDDDMRSGVDHLARAADLGHAKAQAIIENTDAGGHFPLRSPAGEQNVMSQEEQKESTDLQLYAHDLSESPSFKLRKETTSNLDEAIIQLQLGADQGLTEAQYELALLYADGNGVPENEDEAVRLLQLAADNDYAPALYTLGQFAASGFGLEEDPILSFTLIKKSAELGHAEAQCYLGDMYAYGLSVPADKSEAVRWYRTAAENGDAEAQNILGNMYLRGSGVSRNRKTAMAWIRKAALQEHVPSQFLLAQLYSIDTENAADLKDAAKWYRRAADNGLPAAMYQFGRLSLIGQGTEKNRLTAVEYILNAAEHNNLDAQLWLASAYHNGIILEPDPEKGQEWLERASKNKSLPDNIILAMHNSEDPEE